MATDPISYDRQELKAITKSFKAMDDEAVDQAKQKSSALASFVQSSIIDSAASVRRGQSVALRIATGSTVSKSSKIGEISFGFARQKFSGGATTQQLWGGSEFGSNRYKQFPQWSGRYNNGSRGWWIYPELRRIQPEIVQRWNEGFSQIVKKFN